MRRLLAPVALALASLVASALLLEAGARAWLSWRSADASILLHGTRFAAGGPSPRWSTRAGEARWDRIVRVDERRIKVFVDGPFGSYSRYQPHSVRGMKLADGSTWRVVHNGFGFRGPDVPRRKPPGVVRVIALGASSTFGYLDRDDETYPHQLEQRLSERLASEGCSDVRRFEVLNLGIPHLDSSGIYALFMSEGLAFEPDVVTFYEGANDTRRIERSLGERALLELSRVSVAMLALAELIETRLESFDALDLERHLRGVVERFLGNLARIADECERRGIRFVVVSQQARSFAVPDERLAQVGYDEEAEIVRAELDAGQRLDLARLQFLMHAQITSALRAWVAARGVPFVDFIAALEQEGQRASLMSWVHLAPAGNRVLADRLAREIFASVCPSD